MTRAKSLVGAKGFNELYNRRNVNIVGNIEIVKEEKWLIFELSKIKLKTKVFDVIGKCEHPTFGKPILGQIKWHPQWRHYCFFPNHNIETVHSDRCLLSISRFITKLNKEHKIK